MTSTVTSPNNPGATPMTVRVPTLSRPAATHRRQLQVAAVIPLVALLAACGGGGTASSSAAATQAPSSTAGSGGQGGTGTFPGVSGLIAAASPGTLQVQSSSAQNTVLYTAATTFTRVATGHIAAGECITVTGTPEAGSTPALTATSVRIEAKVNGACPTTGAGGGFPGGGAPGGGLAQRPSGAPTSDPAGGSGARRAFASATGTVSSVTGSTILVKGVLRNGQSATGSATPPSPATITITVGTSTTVTQTVAATSGAAVVGQCARATGSANSVGAITATSITITPPGADGCNTGFGGRGNGANGTRNPGPNA